LLAGASRARPLLQVAREAALNKRAKELADKEKKLNALEKELQSSGGMTKKNWPICWPFLYHNIPEEIPEKSRRVVREIYVCWWVSAGAPKERRADRAPCMHACMAMHAWRMGMHAAHGHACGATA
jgi:hypothetical protein